MTFPALAVADAQPPEEALPEALRRPNGSAILAIPILKVWTPVIFRILLANSMPDREALLAQPFLPYGRQEIADADVKAVVEALVPGG